MTQQPTPPNWYPDNSDPSLLRWWDGHQWTNHTQPKPAVTPQPVTPAQAQTQEQAKIPVFGGKKRAEELQAILEQIGGMDYMQVQQATVAARQELAQEQSRLAAVRQELAILSSEIVNVRKMVTLQESGFYDFDHPAESSANLAADLAAVRQEIKYAIADGNATTATTTFTYNQSLAQGKKFVAQLSKAMLAYYNSETENCIKSVKAGNLQSAQARLDKAIQLVQKNGEMISLRITPTFHRLRSKELGLAARHLEAIQREKEIERERRAEQREAEKADRELQAERDKLEKERQHYLKAIEAMRQQGNEAGVADLQAKIDEVDHAITDVDSRAANIRAGYVYVISNVGAFGPDVVKIGMTRRLDPMDRVRELGDASVPFRFDVHALFFSDDAVGIETALHHVFEKQRINRINAHREFYKVTPAQVLDALKASRVHVVEFTMEPEAGEFRASGGDILTGEQDLPGMDRVPAITALDTVNAAPRA